MPLKMHTDIREGRLDQSFDGVPEGGVGFRGDELTASTISGLVRLPSPISPSLRDSNKRDA
jgi:hypothetical protein